MADDPETGPASVLIVGGGLSGFTVAQELRRRDYTGRLVLIDAQGLPYDRPPLSKGYLGGQLSAEGIAFAEESWYAEHAVELIADSVVALDPAAGRVELASGASQEAEVVVLATGGTPRRLPVPGGDDAGLFVLRVRSDADRLRAALSPGRRLAVIGAGLIGAEVASTASELGARITVIDPVEMPGVPAFGLPVATELQRMHSAHGVGTRTALTTAIERTGAGWTVRLDGAEDVEADLVLVAVGIVPDTDLAAAAGLDVDGGVLVDASQRTSHPRVFAVGDGARQRLPGGELTRRHEHWESALHTGQTAAAAILGQEQPEHPAPWMWSDRYGVHAEAVGSMTGGELVVRQRDGRPWVTFCLDDRGRVQGASSIDGGIAIRAARRLIASGAVVDPARLADPDVDLKRLLREG